MDFIPFERVFPNGNVTLVFHYGSPSKFKEKNSNEYVESNLVICGQQTSYYDLSLSGKTGMILIVFKPHGVEPFFNFPINELLNKNLSVCDLIKNEAIVLEDKLFNSKNNKQRITHLENFLLKRMIINKDFERVEHAIKIIENSKGQIKTQVIAQEVCLGIKQFERIFSKHVGLNPKKFTSIVRFQNVIQMKMNDKNANMCQLAYDNGYYDQSHFIHDFKNLTGLSPRDFYNDWK
ncbi:MAG: helix-turn-helix domain-containing protein [Lutibacter sp.]|nr:helix-turn-helix domain-containing protein [Lutibacter sp.]